MVYPAEVLYLRPPPRAHYGCQSRAARSPSKNGTQVSFRCLTGGGTRVFCADRVRKAKWYRSASWSCGLSSGGANAGVVDDGFTRAKLAVFLSGGGSNFRALHASTLSDSIYGDFAVVVSDKPGCKGCDYAREHGLPILSFPLSTHAPDGLSPPDLVAALRTFGVDYVLLAGYLKLLPTELVQAYPRSVVNIHPALLPAFGGKGYFGMKVHEAVIKSGARFSGPTVHFVDTKYDSGVILAQRIVPVLADDSPMDLAARVLKEVKALSPCNIVWSTNSTLKPLRHSVKVESFGVMMGFPSFEDPGMAQNFIDARKFCSVSQL